MAEGHQHHLRVTSGYGLVVAPPEGDRFSAGEALRVGRAAAAVARSAEGSADPAFGARFAADLARAYTLRPSPSVRVAAGTASGPLGAYLADLFAEATAVAERLTADGLPAVYV